VRIRNKVHAATLFVRKDKMEIADRYHLDRAREWIAQLYRAWGKPEKEAEWKKK
jgi:hypothetical protein